MTASVAPEKEKCLYKILGVKVKATDDEIRFAYLKLALKFHPDKAVQNGVSQEEATEQFRDILCAYQILSNPRQRSLYDQLPHPVAWPCTCSAKKSASSFSAERPLSSFSAETPLRSFSSKRPASHSSAKTPASRSSFSAETPLRSFSSKRPASHSSAKTPASRSSFSAETPLSSFSSKGPASHSSAKKSTSDMNLWEFFCTCLYAAYGDKANSFFKAFGDLLQNLSTSDINLWQFFRSSVFAAYQDNKPKSFFKVYGDLLQMAFLLFLGKKISHHLLRLSKHL